MASELKICTKCGREKSVENDFYLNRTGKRSRPRCKKCMDDDHKEYMKKKLEITPDYNRSKWQKHVTTGMRRKYKMRQMYGITLEQYEEIFVDQKGICPICSLELIRGRTSVIDHSHVTGKVRGIIHQRCNNALGNFLDSPEICKRAADYLESGGFIRIELTDLRTCLDSIQTSQIDTNS